MHCFLYETAGFISKQILLMMCTALQTNYLGIGEAFQTQLTYTLYCSTLQQQLTHGSHYTEHNFTFIM